MHLLMDKGPVLVTVQDAHSQAVTFLTFLAFVHK